MPNELLAHKGLKIDRLSALIEVAEAGGYTRAAHRQPGRQSQLSKYVGELEEVFGKELLRGDGKGATLTPEGERLVAITREFFSALEVFAADCRDQPVEFSVGVGDALLQWLFLPGIAHLRKELPNVVFDVRSLKTSEIAAGVGDFRLHFGILRKGAVPKGHKCTPLGKHTYSLFVPKAQLSAGKRDWKHVIEKVPIATISGEGAFRAGLVNEAKRLGVQLKCALACSSFPQAGKALETGAFAAILPDIAANELDGDRFTRLDAPFLTKQARDICLIWHRRLTKLRPETQKVVDCLAKVLQLPQQE